MDSIIEIAKRKADADMWIQSLNQRNVSNDPVERAGQEVIYAKALIAQRIAQQAYDAYIDQQVSYG